MPPRRCWVAGLCLLPLGCHMPVDVVRVEDPSAPQGGIRYRLLEPDYAVSLKLREPDGWEQVTWSVPGAGPGRSPSIADVTSYLNSMGDPAELELAIEQKLVAGAMYEVRAPWYHLLNPFAESEVSLDLVCAKGPADGTLKAFTGGVKDHTAKVIEAVVGLAKSVAAAAPPTTTPCIPQWLDDYLVEHVELRGQAAEALRRKDTLQRRLGNGTITDLEQKQLEALGPLCETLLERLKAHRHPLVPAEYSLTVEGQEIVAPDSTGTSPKLVDITLSPRRSAP